MTPPLLEGSGFSLSRFRSFAKGKPCPENVFSRVHVGVRGMPARRTSELGLGDAVLRSAVPAAGTGAGGVGGVHRDQLATGALSLVREHTQEHPPTRVQNASIQAGLGGDVPAWLLDRAGRAANHVRDPQVLVHDQVIVADQVERDLVRVIKALPPDLRMQGSNPRRRLKPPFATPLLAGEVALRGSEPVGGGGEVARVGHLRPVAGSDQGGHTHVDPNHRPRGGKRLGWHVVAGQDHVPAVALPLDADRLHPAAYGAVLVHADMPDSLEPHERGLGVFGLGVPAAAVTVLRPFDRVEPAAALEAGEARLLPGLKAAEERGERLIQPSQGGLLGGKRPSALPVRVVGSDVLQLGRLVFVPDRHTCLAVGGAAVLKGRVVQLAVVLQARGERDLLAASGTQQELVRPSHRLRRRLSVRRPSARSTHAAALIEIPACAAYSSICRFNSGGTRRFSDSRCAPLTTTRMLPQRVKKGGSADSPAS